MRVGLVITATLLLVGCRGGGEKPAASRETVKSAPAPLAAAPVPVEAARTYEVGGEVLPPVAIRQTAPKLPGGLHVKNPGPILLNAVIDETGRVENVKIVQDSDPPLARYFADETPNWRFRPATLHGRPVRVYYTIRVSIDVK